MLSDYHKHLAIKQLAKIIIEGNQDPATSATLNLDTWQPHDTGTNQVGQPKNKWLKETFGYAWEHMITGTKRRTLALNLDMPAHKQENREYSTITKVQ